MTIASPTNRQAFAGDGISTAFVFAFPFTAAADLKVVRRDGAGGETLLALASDYTVSPAGGSPTGGTVTTTMAPLAGTTLHIIRNLPLTQPLALQDGGPLPAASANGAWDRLTMIAQRLYELVTRSPTLRETDAWGAGKIDAGGNEFTNAATGTASSSLATVGQVGALIAGGGNVPGPSLSDVGKFLKATATGVFGWVSILASDIGLGALLNGITATTQAPFDSSAKLATTAYADRAGIGRNLVINGDMSVAQRGTTFGTPANGAYTLDRWSVLYDGTIGTFNIFQGILALGQPSGRERINNLIWQQTAAGSGSSFRQINQRIKGVRTLAGQTCTLSFYASADVARSLGVQLYQIFGTGGSPSGTVQALNQTASLTTSSQRFSYTFTMPGLSGKTLGSNGDDYLQLTFALPLNTTMTITLQDVQLEIGPQATEYERKSFERELADCLPYYEKSFVYAGSPVQNNGAGGSSHNFPQAVAASTAMNAPGVRFRVRKIKPPTVVLMNPQAANAQARNTSIAADCSATATAVITEDGFGVSITTPAASAAGNAIYLNWSAEAEL